MKLRKLIIGSIGVAILVLGIILSGRLANSENLPPEIIKSEATAVKTIVVTNGTVNTVRKITGRVQAADKIDLYAEVSGVAGKGTREFKTGTSFKKGETLLKMDQSEFESALISTKSQFTSTLANVLPDIKIDFPADFKAWSDFLSAFDIRKPSPKLPAVNNSQLKLFLTGRNIYTNYYKIQEAETRLSKFVIKAPFDGTLTEAYINEGTLVRVGQQLGEFIKTGEYELEASVQNRLVSSLKIGMKLQFSEVGNSDSYEGNLVRINNKVDQGTQLVKVFFSLTDRKLKSGMYLESSIPMISHENAVRLPLSCLLEDEYVYTIENGIAVKKKILLLEKDTETIVVSGLENNSKVISDRKNSAFEGSNVAEM